MRGLSPSPPPAAEELFANLNANAHAARTEGWLREHKESVQSDTTGAWKTYTAGQASKRSMIADAITLLEPNVRVAYADLVDSMETLIKGDVDWDVGKGGHLDRTDRPKAVTAMVNRRGGMLTKEGMGAGFGEGMRDWWRSLQPAERGDDQNLAELLDPRADMEWGSLGDARGYKGAFLLVWCMMHWVKFEDMTGWLPVAEDMTRVFKAVQSAREGGGHEEEELGAAKRTGKRRLQQEGEPMGEREGKKAKKASEGRGGRARG
ncbi:hypothetical protein PENSPDRAFT_695336 [Peniophora sp. CONT]|nr:hypothetical protein PENSPDRAFT_695336 [Peniophora sp. CONT]